MTKNQYLNGLKWIARVTGTLLVIFTLIMGIGSFVEGLNRSEGSPFASLNPLILIIFIIWGIALAGLIAAFWKEGLGGIISLSCFVIMYILNLFNKEASMRGSAITIFLIFSIPAILYLIYWILNRKKSKQLLVDNPESQSLDSK